jgi:hypothetical protein
MHAKKWFCGVSSGILTIFCISCNDGLHVSPVFEGIDLESVLVGSEKPDDTPELRSRISNKPEYNFKDCQLILSVPINQTSNTLHKVLLNYKDAVVRLGGTILGETNIAQWGSRELTYETRSTKGFFRLYSAEIANSKTKIVAIVLECPRR